MRLFKKAAAVISAAAVMLSASAVSTPKVGIETKAASSHILAFPGAVGGGKYSTGGFIYAQF